MPTVATSSQESAQAAVQSLAPSERRVLSERELARRWGVSSKTLQRWRTEGRGPRYLKLSKRVSYPLEFVVNFERSVVHESTSERVAMA